MIDSPYNGTDSFKKATVAAIRNQALAYPSERTNTVFVRTSLSSARGMAMSVIHQYESTYFS